MRRRGLLRAGLSVGGLFLAGCAGDDGSDPGETTQPSPAPRTGTASATATPTPAVQASATSAVTIRDRAFDPLAIRVSPGTEVSWHNASEVSHTVESAVFNPEVATEWAYYSADMPPGRTATHTFPEPGVYEYACTIHGADSMCGVVLVGEAAVAAPLPCSE
jgi:plastocyanin